MSGFPALKARTTLDGSSARWGTLYADRPSDRAMPAETDAVLASMLATCGDCIKILDLQGRVLFVNDAGPRMMEFDDLSLLEGRRWTDFMAGAVEMAERTRMDVRLQDLQTELFHAARLSAAGQMAATLAHELNQPLTATTSSISAARRLLADGAIDLPTTQEVIAEAASQARRAGQIVRRLRDFVARGETEKRFESVATVSVCRRPRLDRRGAAGTPAGVGPGSEDACLSVPSEPGR